MRVWILFLILVLAGWTSVWGIVIDSGIGEFSDVFENSVLVESQGLYGFSGWLVDPTFAGSMGGPAYRFGQVLEFRIGPFGTLRPTLLPVNPIAVDSFAVEHDYRGSSTSAWRLDRDSKSKSPGTIRYRLSIGGDTGDPLIHRYTQSEWNRYNRDKIGPTHALYLGRRVPLTNGGVMDVSLAGGERRYSTLTPENQESRSMLSPVHAHDWNQQRWVSGSMTLPQACLEAGFCDFGGWEYFPILGFELPVEGWTAGAGAEIEIPLTQKLQSRGTVSWSGFGVEYPTVKGITFGNHRHSDLRLRHRLKYQATSRLAYTFDQELKARTFLGWFHFPELSYLPGEVHGFDFDGIQVIGIYRLSSIYRSGARTLSGIPSYRIMQSIGYYKSNGGLFDGEIKIEKHSQSGVSQFGINVGSYIRLIDPIENWFAITGTLQDESRFSINGSAYSHYERLYLGRVFLQQRMYVLWCNLSVELTANPRKIRPIRSNLKGELVGGMPVSSVYYYPKGRQDDVTVTCQIRKEPIRIFGGRAEYRYHRSWQGVSAGIPEHRGIVELQARIQTGLKASLTWQGFSSSDWSDMVAGDNTELPAWGVWSLSLSQTAFHGKLEGTIRIWNLSDQLIRIHPLGPMRPRRLEIAIQVKIG